MPRVKSHTRKGRKGRKRVRVKSYCRRPADRAAARRRRTGADWPF
jgi:hypothetical protein